MEPRAKRRVLFLPVQAQTQRLTLSVIRGTTFFSMENPS